MAMQGRKGDHGGLQGGRGIVVSRHTTKRTTYAHHADHVQDLAVPNSHLDTLAGDVAAGFTVTGLIAAGETQAELAVWLGKTVGGADEIAAFVADPGENRGKVGDTLCTMFVMFSVHGLAHGQAGEIKTDDGLEVGIACHDVGGSALGYAPFVLLSDQGAEVDDEKRSVNIQVRSMNGHYAMGHLGRKSLPVQTRRDLEDIRHLMVGGNSGACLAKEQVLKLDLERPAQGGDGHFSSNGVEVLRNPKQLVMYPRKLNEECDIN